MKNQLLKCIILLATLMPGIGSSQVAEKAAKDSPTFVLVHGTFQWGGQWNPLSAILKKEGFTVHSPTLTGHGYREHLLSKQIGLSTHITDVVNYINWLDLKNVILVGHSYGGCVITGVADRLPKRIAHIVYLDAAVMKHGESLHADHFTLEMAKHIQESVDSDGDGWLIVPEFLRDPAPATMCKHAFKSYTDRIDLKGDHIKSGTVIVATEMPETFTILREKGEKRAKERNWMFHRVEGPHPLQETSPSREKVAEILLKIARSTN